MIVAGGTVVNKNELPVVSFTAEQKLLTRLCLARDFYCETFPSIPAIVCQMMCRSIHQLRFSTYSKSYRIHS